MAFQDIRKSRKWLSANEIGIIALILVLLAGLLALNLYLARTLPAGEWLYQRWSGARAFVVNQAEPYTTEIARDVQQMVYGREAFANEYRYVPSDPFYMLLLYTPLALFPKFEIARGLWMLLAEIVLVFIALFSFRLSDWEPPRGLYFLLMGFSLFSFFSLDALLTASPAIFLTFLYLSILLALRSFSDELAGALLVLAAYQWEVGGLFFICILIFVFANRRWSVLMGFGMSLIVLLVASFLTHSGWVLPYFRAVLSNWYQNADVNLNHIISGWFPNQRVSIAGAVSMVMIFVVIIEAFGSIDAPFRRVVWTASLALAAMPLVGLGMFSSNYVVLVLPLILIVALVWERWTRFRILRIALILLAAFVVPFGLYLQTVFVYAPLYTELLTVLPPVAAILGLYWMRWWVLHSPRVWADQIGFRR
jgi:hypothetical protein